MVTAVSDPQPPPRRTAFAGPLKWWLLECAHYGTVPGRTRFRSGDAVDCKVCGEQRRAVQPANG
jgi:hypothetical protein